MTLKKLFSTAALLTVLCSFAADKAPVAPQPGSAGNKNPAVAGEKNSRPRSRRRQEDMIWHAFSRMSETERRSMMKLQRTDPEKFRAEMLERAEKIAAARRARMMELNKMAASIRNCKDEEKAAELRSAFTAELKKDYLRRIENSRSQLEKMKQRAAKLEAELNRRTKNADKAVETWAEIMISGKKKAPHHRFFNRQKRAEKGRITPEK